jgi:tetratricopeptide (TPR) repeat protein
MTRTRYLGISLLLVFALAAAALPSFGQAAQAKGPQAKTQAEYNAYTALYNEKNPQKKAELGEKFVVDFKESDFVGQSYTMMLGAYTAAQAWPKVIDAAERAVALPTADNKLKAFAYANAMVASQNLNQIDKVVAYGDKVLAIEPNDLNAMITLSSIIPAKLPSDEAGKKSCARQSRRPRKESSNWGRTAVGPGTGAAKSSDHPDSRPIARHPGTHRV